MIRFLARRRASEDGRVASDNAADDQLKQGADHLKVSATRNISEQSLKANGLFRDVKEELQCGICLEEYSMPRILTCGH
jgi:hypothetical protein